MNRCSHKAALRAADPSDEPAKLEITLVKALLQGVNSDCKDVGLSGCRTQGLAANLGAAQGLAKLQEASIAADILVGEPEAAVR